MADQVAGQGFGYFGGNIWLVWIAFIALALFLLFCGGFFLY